jgi:hypothetical protein
MGHIGLTRQSVHQLSGHKVQGPTAAVAARLLARDRGLGLFFGDIPDLAGQLRDREQLARIREQVWAQRLDFSFDAHADALVDFFRKVIAAT